MRKNENRVQCWIYVCVLLLNNSKWFFRFTDYGKDNVFFLTNTRLLPVPLRSFLSPFFYGWMFGNKMADICCWFHRRAAVGWFGVWSCLGRWAATRLVWVKGISSQLFKLGQDIPASLTLLCFQGPHVPWSARKMTYSTIPFTQLLVPNITLPPWHLVAGQDGQGCCK